MIIRKANIELKDSDRLKLKNLQRKYASFINEWTPKASH